MRIVATSDTHFPFSADKLPDGDVLIHAGDLMYTGYPDDKHFKFEHVGGLAMNRWFYKQEKKPSVWIHGHIHESYGHAKVEGCDFFNVAMCDHAYEQTNTARIIDL